MTFHLIIAMSSSVKLWLCANWNTEKKFQSIKFKYNLYFWGKRLHLPEMLAMFFPNLLYPDSSHIGENNVKIIVLTLCGVNKMDANWLIRFRSFLTQTGHIQQQPLTKLKNDYTKGPGLVYIFKCIFFQMNMPVFWFTRVWYYGSNGW